ncbi:MAG: hypothetical protein ETSY2_39575 [Candidatus Entotheonella gemina]|uniref:Uncharacterized protein n=1 Tax=Candidatus Entotheonella gemina TaxID=1429439 RepID=W4LS03_9BACT|nr:MAG: hypothetical protein ETSY2_39575 [Candidatus Entotheonella gemina]
MAIEEIEIELPASMSINALPEQVARVIQKSDRRWELFCDSV